MSFPLSTSRFQGNIPPVVTPLSEPDRLDEAGCERLLEHLIAGGVDGIFLLGSSGELPSLSRRLRAEFVRIACRLIAGRVPVLVGVTDVSLVETNELTNVAADAGADAVVLTTPYYYPISQAEFIAFAQGVLEETDLPLLLYNMPAMTKLSIDFDTVAELAQIDQIVGIKDSSQDIAYFRRIAQLRAVRPDWTFLIGHETLLAESLQLGGTGGVNLGTNLFPRLFARLMLAHRAADGQNVARYQAQIDQLQAIYQVATRQAPLLPLISITKTALREMGICDDCLAAPHQRCSIEQREQLAKIVKRLQAELEI